VNNNRPGHGPYGLLHPVSDRALDAGMKSRETKQEEEQVDKLAQHQVQILLAHLPLTQPISLGAAMVLVILFHGKTQTPLLIGWFVTVAVILSARYLFFLVNQRFRIEHPQAWLKAFTASLFALGVAWGMVVLILPSDSVIETVFAAIWVCLLAAGSVSAYSIRPSALLAYTVPSIVPIAAYLIAQLDVMLSSIGGALLLFLMFMIAAAKRTHETLAHNVLMQEEKESLIRELDTEKQYVEELNEILRADILEREQAENELRKAKDAAENLAEKLTLLSSLDGLTEISNRRHFDESLHNEWSRASRNGTPVSLILTDIDYFKRYNDHYGHQAGDECLRTIAGVLRNFCRRGGDMAARYGGEEFAMLLPNTELKHAANMAERIRSEIVQLGIPHDASDTADVVTASFGVATLTPQRELRPELLVLTADRALYRAKDAGRNNIKTALPLEDVESRSG